MNKKEILEDLNKPLNNSIRLYFPNAFDKDKNKRQDLCYLGIELYENYYTYCAGLYMSKCKINSKIEGFKYLSDNYGWLFQQEFFGRWNSHIEYNDEDLMHITKKIDISGYTISELTEKAQVDLDLIYTFIGLLSENILCFNNYYKYYRSKYMREQSRLRKTEQIIKLAMMFQNSYCGLCIDDIKDEFECSRRSAERMKTLLFDLFPEKIEEVETQDKKKRWRFVKGAANCLISFTPADFANLEYLKGLSNDENRQKELDELIAKIKALTPQKNLQSLDTDVSAIMESEGFAVRQYSRVKTNPKILEKLRNAMLAFKRIKFSYPTEKGTKEITLNPYGVIISDKYYLVGFNEYVNDLRLYKVDKIADLQILDEYFEKDEQFSLKDFCNKSFSIYQEKPLNITLEFDKNVAEDVLNYHFHPTQKIKPLDNGNIQVKFTSGGTYAICQELFRWGTNVKIKRPASLKKYYRQYLTDVLNNL